MVQQTLHVKSLVFFFPSDYFLFLAQTIDNAPTNTRHCLLWLKKWCLMTSPEWLVSCMFQVFLWHLSAQLDDMMSFTTLISCTLIRTISIPDCNWAFMDGCLTLVLNQIFSIHLIRGGRKKHHNLGHPRWMSYVFNVFEHRKKYRTRIRIVNIFKQKKKSEWYNKNPGALSSLFSSMKLKLL